MASPNYKFEKRQRELAKKKKKEEKRVRKSGTTDGQPQEPQPLSTGDDKTMAVSVVL
jgi:hypothetical protein